MEFFMKRCFLLMFASLLVVGSAQAQLMFTRSDVETGLVDQDLTIFSSQSLSGVTLDLGGAGAGQVYDFTGFNFQQTTYQTIFISPDATPYTFDFPTATHSQILGTTNPAFGYYRIDDNGYYDLGTGMEISDMPYILKYDPEMLAIKFPLQLGTSWSYSGNEITPMEGFFQKTDMQVDVVSEGILMTTQGSWQALCVRNNKIFSDRYEVGGVVLSENVTHSVSYMFMTKDGVSASVIVDTLDAASWNPHVTYASVTFYQLPSAVYSATAPDGFGILSVYPHPVTGGSAVVAWNTDGPSILTLHDNSGRELRRIASDGMNGVQQKTSLAVHDLPAGIYFLRLSQGATVARKPMLILR
jgi:hypothetical protein